MPLLTFNPGPSKLTEETKNDLRDALDLGIPEMSHRSNDFNAMSEAALVGLRDLLSIPKEYHVFYTSSATEAMELTIRNLVRKNSAHFTCGRFSELFKEISEANGKTAEGIPTAWGKSPMYEPSAVSATAELVTITANETSTGMMCSNEAIKRVHSGCPNALLAVDITSLAGMKVLSIETADVWLFSVQKGFGLPGGLGLLIVSPRAFKRSVALQQSHENLAGTFTFQAMEKLMQKGGQTICTPNVLNIFLLGRTVARWNLCGGLKQKQQETEQKAALVYAAVKSNPRLHCFVEDPDARSISIACIGADAADIARLHTMAKEQDIILGKGYGKLKESTFRLALFPAITEEDLQRAVRLFEALNRP